MRRLSAALSALLAVALLAVSWLAWDGIGGVGSDGERAGTSAGADGHGEDTPVLSGERADADGGSSGSEYPAQFGMEQVMQEFGSTTSWHVDRPLREACQEVLESYQEQGSCVLVRAGYLDLFGRVWCCTVMGDGWVDTCVVGEEEKGCLVWRARMEVSEVEELAEQENWASSREPDS